MTRTNPEVFNLPAEKIRTGHYSDQYFNHTKAVLEALPPADRPVVRMQVFQKNHAILGGIDEAIAVLKVGAGENIPDPRRATDDEVWRDGWNQLRVAALHEGDEIAPGEPVMLIEGPYHLFAHLETVYLGTLARRTLIGTNVHDVIAAANGKPILYFPARHDHWSVQTGDGFMAHVAGVAGVSTDAQASWWGGRGVGTVPHGLIAAFGGDTLAATVAFAEKFGHEVNVSSLVDFDNDCAATACRVADGMRLRGLPLWGVRLDTSESLVDKGLWDKMGQFKPTGVNPELVRHVRAELDRYGHPDVKIIVSGGFKADKIKAFEAAGVPVDAYGVGSSLIRGANDFTADVVQIVKDAPALDSGMLARPMGVPRPMTPQWVNCAKVGRKLQNTSRLEEVS